MSRLGLALGLVWSGKGSHLLKERRTWPVSTIERGAQAKLNIRFPSGTARSVRRPKTGLEHGTEVAPSRYCLTTHFVSLSHDARALARQAPSRLPRLVAGSNHPIVGRNSKHRATTGI
jgi:hypothetical protein